MKLKAQIMEELQAADKERYKYAKAAENNEEAHDEEIYYEGIIHALEWVLGSKEEYNRLVNI